MKVQLLLLILFSTIFFCYCQIEEQLQNDEESFVRRYHHHHIDAEPVHHYQPPPAPVSHYSPPPAPVQHTAPISVPTLIHSSPDSTHHHHKKVEEAVHIHKADDPSIEKKEQSLPEQIVEHKQLGPQQDDHHESAQKKDEKKEIDNAPMIIGPEKKEHKDEREIIDHAPMIIDPKKSEHKDDDTQIVHHHSVIDDDKDHNISEQHQIIQEKKKPDIHITTHKTEESSVIKHKIDSLKHHDVTSQVSHTIQQSNPVVQDDKPLEKAVSTKNEPIEDDTNADDSLHQLLKKGEKGVDVSHDQNQINWQKVKNEDHIGFAFIKATQGTSYVDPDFKENWKNSGQAGIQRGAYCFFDPNEDPIAQAKLFLQTAPKGELPPVLDFEQTGTVSSTVAASRALQWLKYVQQKTQQKPILYTYPDFSPAILKNKEFAQYPLWISDPNNPTKPQIPSTWNGKYAVWQYGQKKGEPGFQTSVDVDIAH